jgi:hypothetical protein
MTNKNRGRDISKSQIAAQCLYNVPQTKQTPRVISASVQCSCGVGNWIHVTQYFAPSYFRMTYSRLSKYPLSFPSKLETKPTPQQEMRCWVTRFCISVPRFISNNGPARSGAPVFQNVRVTRPISLPQPVPFTLSRNVPTALPQPYPVTFPKPYPVAVPHPVTVSVPRPYPVSVPRPVPVPVPHPVPVAVPQPVGVPVPKPYPVPIPHPVPIPSTVLVGAPAGGISFSGPGGDFLSLDQGASAHISGTLLSLAGSHGLTTGYGYGLAESGFSPILQVPLQLTGFEPSTNGDSTEGNAPGVTYNSQEYHHPGSVDVSGAGGPAASLSYVDTSKTASPPPPVNVLPASSPAIPVPSADNYHYPTGYKVWSSQSAKRLP